MQALNTQTSLQISRLGVPASVPGRLFCGDDENGYTKVPNWFFDWLCSLNLTGIDVRVLLFVFRKTICWKKDSDKISFSQFQKALGVSRVGINDSIKRLVRSNLLVVNKQNGKITSYQLVNSSLLGLVRSNDGTSKVEGLKLVSSTLHTKDNTKETNKREFKIEKRGDTMVAVEYLNGEKL